MFYKCLFFVKRHKSLLSQNCPDFCVYVFMYVCRCACECTSVNLNVTIKGVFPVALHLIFPSVLQGFSCLRLSGTETTYTRPWTGYLYGSWGPKPESSCLCDKHFYQAISPASKVFCLFVFKPTQTKILYCHLLEDCFFGFTITIIISIRSMVPMI